MRLLHVAGMAAILLGAAACSDSAGSDSPPDASLTYEVVTRDISKYHGKRVRWFGQFAKGSARGRTLGKGSSLEAVFVDPSTDLRVELRAFAVEAESEKDSIELLFEVQGKPIWVTGTLAGTRHVQMTVGPPPEEKELEAPLLRSARFERAEATESSGN